MSDSNNSQHSKSFWSTIPGILTGCAALITAITGLITVLITIISSGGSDSTPTLPPATVVVVEANTTPAPVTPSVIGVTPVDLDNDPDEWIEPEVNLPSNYRCPPRVDSLWLQFPGIWYGPFWNADSTAYSIFHDQQFIYVGHSIMGIVGTYEDPGVYNQRNQWVALPNTPFDVCVDTNGFVFAAYIPP